MILLKAQITIYPEFRAEFLRQMQAFVDTSAAESGCISFACYETVTTPNAFIVLQEWEDQAALDRHESAEHVAEFKRHIAGMISSREPTRVYTVTQVSGL